MKNEKVNLQLKYNGLKQEGIRYIETLLGQHKTVSLEPVMFNDARFVNVTVDEGVPVLNYTLCDTPEQIELEECSLDAIMSVIKHIKL